MAVLVLVPGNASSVTRFSAESLRLRSTKFSRSPEAPLRVEMMTTPARQSAMPTGIMMTCLVSRQWNSSKKMAPPITLKKRKPLYGSTYSVEGAV